MFRTDSILPPDPEGLEVLHDREYRVRAYKVSEDELLIRGAVRDQAPPGLHLAEDPDPLTMHHMQVDLHVAFPSAEIIAAEVLFESHPHTTCPTIAEHYQGLVGLSISRGYTHKVRDLFGGPRGCTHTTALLLAMGPIAVQCFWSMRVSTARRDSPDGPSTEGISAQPGETMWRSNLNTCHVWAEDGERVATLQAGEPIEVMLTFRRRFEDLGIPEDQWPMRGH
ncbi:MAG: DUF2889 domain-containing protein [Ilumatobacteraceae bacterium]